MFRQAVAAYHRFAKWTARSAWPRRNAALEVTALEERATPAATPIYVPLTAAPQTVLVAPTVATGGGSLAIPMAGQSMVRLDLIAPGASPPADHTDDAADALVQHLQQTDAPPAPASNAEDATVSDEELAEMLAAQTES